MRAKPFDWRGKINEFLKSTMDEARSVTAGELASGTLDLHGFQEAVFFRETVLRREALADTSYPKQRDHSAHTVNNWLLGWLLYERSPELRTALADACKDRRIERPAREAFGDVWSYASIVHDVGYLFEGSLEDLSWQMDHVMARHGALVVNDFFEHRIWHEWEIHAQRERQLARNAYRSLRLPTDGSLGGVVEGLKTMGNLKPLLKELARRYPNVGLPEDVTSEALDGEFSAFDLWQLHYAWTKNAKMVERVKATREAFDSMAYRGMRGTRMRLVDHGVASGLLLLHLITTYYGIRYYYPDRPAGWKEASWIEFTGANTGLPYNPLYWWGAILWATFAVAIHNVKQRDESDKDKDKKKEGDEPVKVPVLDQPMGLEEDPLAYLGILVDILQEWDRYSVQRGSHLADKASLQSRHVKVDPTKSPLQIDLGDRNVKAEKALNGTLLNWNSLVRIGPL